MARLLNATGYFSSILAAVCLCLAVLAAPIGEARADEPEGEVLGKDCGGMRLNTICTNVNQADCPDITNCNQQDICTCRWNPAPHQKCGCHPK